jgi:predicted Zn-dependent protease
MDTQIIKQLLNSIDLPIDWISLRVIRESNQHRQMRNGIPDVNGIQDNLGVMVEVLANNQMGYGATHLLTPKGVQDAARYAYEQAVTASRYGIYPWKIEHRPPMVGEYISPQINDFNSLSAGEINGILSKICDALKIDDRIIQTQAAIVTKHLESWYISSNGSDIYQNFNLIITDYAATAQEGSVIQKRTDNGWMSRCFQGGLEYFDQPELWDRIQRIGNQAVELLTAEECPQERTNLVLAPDQMLLQIHESVGHPLELDRILGDERNYAGGSFVKPEDFGNLVYGSPLMNVTFDPTIQGEFASYGFDDLGVPAKKEYLIKDGILLRGLGSVESQYRSGLPGVACSRSCNWNRPAIDRMANINLEAGLDSFKDLIKNIERGVYMEANKSWSIDDRRHKFQFSCEYAKLIENGQLTKTLRNPNYRSTTPEFWGNLTGLGNQDTWQMFGSPVCGKGEPNQIIWVGHGSPIAVFSNVEVFGSN